MANNLSKDTRDRIQEIEKRLTAAPDLGGHWLYQELGWLCAHAVYQSLLIESIQARLQRHLEHIDTMLETAP